MKIKDIVREDTDSGDIATVATNLFARPIKRTDNLMKRIHIRQHTKTW